MRFAHAETQKVFEGLSDGAKQIVRAAVYAQKGIAHGLLIKHAVEAVTEVDPYEALDEVTSHIRDCITTIFLNDGISSVWIESELPPVDVFAIVETIHGKVIRVKHPQKPQDQIREEEAARIQFELEKLAYEGRRAREKQIAAK